MWESDHAVLSVPIHNRTDQDIEITSFDKSCNCASVSPPTLVVPANGAASVSVQLDLGRRGGQEVGELRRPFSVELRPVSTNTARSHAWRVRCTAVSRATLNQLAVQFADTNRHGQPARPRTATLTTHVPCHDVVCRPDNAAVTVSVREVEPGKYKLTLTPDTTRPAGEFATRVRVFGWLADNTELVELLAFDVTGEL